MQSKAHNSQTFDSETGSERPWCLRKGKKVISSMVSPDIYLKAFFRYANNINPFDLKSRDRKLRKLEFEGQKS